MKRFLSALLVILMCVGFFPNLEVNATDQNMSNPRITDYTDNQFFVEKLGVLFEKLVNSRYNYFTTTGKTCGNSKCTTCNAANVTEKHPTISHLNVDYSWDAYSCYGFAKWTFKYLYGKDATGVLDNPSNRGNSNTTTVVASTYDGKSSAKKVIQQAKIGDILQSPKPHSMIFLKCDDNYFYVLHSNWAWSGEGRNIVKVSKFSYDVFNKITVYRADNYPNNVHTCPTTPKDNKGKWNFQTKGSKLGACKVCGKEYDWLSTIQTITNKKAILKTSKKNYKVTLYKKPYEDAGKAASGKIIKELPITGTLKNAYGTDWYEVEYQKNKKGYISKTTLEKNYVIGSVSDKSAKKTSTQQESAKSTLKINLTQYPSQHTQGNNFGLRGTVTSNYKITSVKGTVVNSKGKTVLSSNDKPNAKSLDVQKSDLNNSLTFNTLSPGKYTLKVVAVDAYGKKIEESKSFTVKAKASQSNKSQKEKTVTGKVKIPSSWDNLSIRSGPSTDYKIVGSMKNGVKCTVYTEKAKNGWYYVEYNGVKGYAAGNRINLQ